LPRRSKDSPHESAGIDHFEAATVAAMISVVTRPK
jgi:hypothetical protein